MPSRVLREGILTSDRVSMLSFEAEVFYRRLMSIVDDYGRYDGRNAILRAQLYPLNMDKAPEKKMQGWKTECIKAGLIKCYVVEGKEYLQMLDFRQQQKAKNSKWPDPEGQETASFEEEEQTKRAKPKSTGFKKPTVQEVWEYCKSINFKLDAQYFIDSNEAKGWVVGQTKTPMKDWKAVIRTWKKNNDQGQAEKTEFKEVKEPEGWQECFEEMYGRKFAGDWNNLCRAQKDISWEIINKLKEK